MLGRTTFSPEEMHYHPVQYFEARKLMPFPGECKKVHKCRKKHLFIPIYCIVDFLILMTLIWYHVIHVGNGSTSDICIFKYHVLRRGFV